MSVTTLGPRRLFTRADGRERVAVPFWDAILSLVGAIAIGLFAMTLVTIVLMVGVMVATGRQPSLNPGHPLLQLGALTLYAAAGSFAAWRLRAMGRPLLQRLSGSDWRAVSWGLLALLLLHIATAVQLTLTHQTKHVQSGFEHFSVLAGSPLLTALTVGLAVSVLVVAGPVVEEILFRGLLFGALAPALGVLGAAALTAVLFGATHGDWVLFPTLAGLGFISAIAYAATGNLSVSVILHATNNALGAVVLVADSLGHH